MEKLRYISDAFACLVESYFMFKLISVQCGYREDRYGNWQKGIWIFGVLLLYINNIPFMGLNESVLGTLLFMLCLIVYGFVFLKKTMGYKLVVLMIGFLVVTLIDSLVIGGYTLLSEYGKDIVNTIWNPELRILLTLLSKCILMIVTGIYVTILSERKRVNIAEQGITSFFIGLGAWICFVVLGGCSLVTSYEFFFFQIIYCVVMLFIIGFLVYLISRMERLNDEKLEYQMSLQQQNMEQQHYREGKKLYNSLREMRHDLKHHVAYMDYLLEGKEYNKLAEYIKQLGEKGCN